MNEQLQIQNLLRTKLLDAQTRNPAVSLRAFANRLGIGAGPLSQILSGQRRVSRNLAQRICDALLLDPQERHEVLSRFPQKRPVRPQDSAAGDSVGPDYLKLTADQFKVISDWYCYAILSLIRTKGFKNDPAWIAGRLGIKVTEAKSALERLLRLELIEADESGKLRRTINHLRTTDDITSLSIRRGHLQTLELARHSLEQDPVNRRDFTTVTFPTHPKRLKAAKELIRKFQDDLTLLMEGAPEEAHENTEVYRFSTELFPLTKETKLTQKKENV